MFSPGVAFRFTRGSRAIDAFVCFHCREVAFQEVGAHKSLAKLSFFGPLQERLFELTRKARPDDARLDAVRKEWDEEIARVRKYEADEARWHAAMPSSLAPHWQAMADMGRFGTSPPIEPINAALRVQYPESRTRILALLEWYGTDAGPWSGYPAYEGVAQDLLLTDSTSELLAAIEGQELSPRQLEGAARLFGGWEFGRARPQDLALLPRELRERLLLHSLESDDEDKKRRARRAFSRE
jgi:hypothetical protein